MLENKGGIICNVDDLEAFISAIERLKDKKLREQMGKFNKRKVVKEYSMKSVLQKLDKIYREE